MRCQLDRFVLLTTAMFLLTGCTEVEKYKARHLEMLNKEKENTSFLRDVRDGKRPKEAVRPYFLEMAKYFERYQDEMKSNGGSNEQELKWFKKEIEPQLQINNKEFIEVCKELRAGEDDPHAKNVLTLLIDESEKRSWGNETKQTGLPIEVISGLVVFIGLVLLVTMRRRKSTFLEPVSAA